MALNHNIVNERVYVITINTTPPSSASYQRLGNKAHNRSTVGVTLKEIFVRSCHSCDVSTRNVGKMRHWMASVTTTINIYVLQSRGFLGR